MPRNKNKKKMMAVAVQHKKQQHPMSQPAKKKHANAHLGMMVPHASGDPKIRTTQASNNRMLKSPSVNGVKDSEKAAVGILDPFAAFQRQYKTGLPFAPSTLPCFGFWTRQVTRSTELQFGASPTEAGAAFIVVPSCNPLVISATSMTAAGVMATTAATADQQYTFINANFESLAVGYQGVRVRNLTPVLNQGGEMVIGLSSYNDATINDFDQVRSASTTITHSNGDPGVIAQCSYIGNPNDNPRGPTLVSDYTFTDPGVSGVDPESRCIVFRSYGSQLNPQIFEIEIVTYYLGIPFSQTSQLLAPVRYDVTPAAVNRLLDAAFNKAPMFSIPRNFVKDDGWDTLWTGAKAIISDIGLGLIGSAASAIGSAFASLFDAKHRHRGMLRLCHMVPAIAWDDLKKLVNEHPTRSLALAALQDVPPPSRFSESDLFEIATYMRNQTVDIPSTAAAAPATPGWKVFSR